MPFDNEPTYLEQLDERLAKLATLGFKHLPSVATLVREQAAMLATFHRRQVPPRLWRPMEACQTGRCERRPCAAACHFGERLEYLTWVKEAADIFLEDCLSSWWVTVANPRYRTAVGALQQFEPRRMLQVLRRALCHLEAEVGPVRAFGAIEAALSVELDGSRQWDPHPHIIIAGRGLDETIIRRHFMPSGPKLVGIKPVVAKPAYNEVGALGYAGKRHPLERFAYIGSDGRQDRNEHGVSAADRAEYDRWLLSLRKGERLIMYRLRRVHGHLVRLP